jgi:predicted ATPase
MRVYSIQPGELREMQDPDGGTSLSRNGSNTASVLKDIQRRHPDRFSRISRILELIVPKTLKVGTIKHGKKLSLEFTQDFGTKQPLKLEAFNMSDGTLRAVGLLAAVYQQPDPTLIVIEEPEATIHPGALRAILDLLLDASKRMQVVITTHSPELLDAKWITDVHLRIAHWQAGATRITRLSDMPRQALQQHLMGAGELLRSNALDAPPTDHAMFQSEFQPTLFESIP